MPDLDEGEPAPVEPAPRKPTPPRGESLDAEEDSVDAYMARLLERARVGKPEQSPPAETAEPVRQAIPLSSHRTEYQEPLNRHGSRELSAPRATACEKQVNLSAMRELANLSAQTAIHSHAKNRLQRASRTKLLVSGLGLLVGSGMMWAYWHDGAGVIALYVAMASLLISLIWAVQSAVLMAHGLRGAADDFQRKAEPAPGASPSSDSTVAALSETDGESP